MKKILFILFCPVAFIGASAQTGKVSVNAGFLSKYAECHFGL